MHRSRRRRLIVACLLSSVGMSAGVISAALPESPQTRRADSRDHTYCLTDISGYTAEAIYAMETLDNTTIMYDVSASCSTTVDVWWFAADLSGSLRGQWSCDFPGGASVCDSADIEIDFAYIDQGSNDWWDRRKTTVHEVGHSVGLTHDSSSAMISGEIPSAVIQWLRYTSGDVGQINSQY